MKNSELLQALFGVFLIATAAAQNPTPDQARQLELQKEAMRRAAQSAPVKIIGWPTLRPLRPIRILPPLKKMENK